jgi:hypothetical protein
LQPFSGEVIPRFSEDGRRVQNARRNTSDQLPWLR